MTITLYTMPNCPHCVRAKAALDEHGIHYNVVNMPDRTRRDEFYDLIANDMALYPENVRRTMPKLDVDGTWVPSADDIVALCEAGLI